MMTRTDGLSQTGNAPGLLDGLVDPADCVCIFGTPAFEENVWHNYVVSRIHQQGTRPRIRQRGTEMMDSVDSSRGSLPQMTDDPNIPH